MRRTLAHESQSWAFPQERHEPFVHAAVAAWKDLDSVGPRYYAGAQGERLWSVPNNLHYVLANMGVPTEVLRAPLPPGGPAALLQYAREIARANHCCPTVAQSAPSQ